MSVEEWCSPEYSDIEKQDKSVSRRYYTFTALAMLIYIAGMQSLYAGQQCDAIENPKSLRFSGTFIQLLPEIHNKWTLSQWSRLFFSFKALGVRQLVIQWSAYNNQDSFPFGQQAPAVRSELDTLFILADQFDMSIYVGLNFDPMYWSRIEQDSQSVRKYLQSLSEKNVQLAQALVESSQTHQSFSGWYITEEIDDINWNASEKRSILLAYLQSLGVQLHQLTPNKPVAISGFSNAALPPFNLGQLWHEIFSNTAIDIVLFQDGVGVNKLTMKQLPDYFSAVNSAARFNHKKFQVVIEVFKQIAGTPLNDKTFKAVAASPERVLKQMEIASVYSPELLAFSIPEYMTPDNGSGGQCLYDNFRMPLDRH